MNWDYLRRLMGWTASVPAAEAVVPTSKEWDLTCKGWGNNTITIEIIDGGQELRLGGHHPQAYKFRIGDTIILPNRAGETTRYCFEKLEVMWDPRDQWFGTAFFLPRKAVSPAPNEVG